ncbi:MAG: autotransporter strand-loop-strand O-heptosyltransferase [Quinella sp. 2Q5]|nr:autotransporter strand-loop-strand O-heptosyltransferase [Quinella sp. 2Q5]
MRKHFFTTRNIADYRKFFSRVVSEDKLDGDTEQKFFFACAKRMLGVSDAAFDSPIVGETGIEGLRLDFNMGLRLDVPAGDFRVVISDGDSGQIFFDENISDGRLISAEQFFIRWQVDVFRGGMKIFSHKLNLEGRRVLIAFVHSVLGDTLAMLPFVREFKRHHGCDVKIFLPKFLREFAANLYPDLPQADVTFDNYATYHLVLAGRNSLSVPVEMRNLPMERAGGTLLGISTLPREPTFRPTAPPVTDEPYVCIGVQASTNRKGWLYSRGWDIVVDYLKRLGYRVFCIDKHATETNDGCTITMPAAAEDFTGDYTIMHRANMLAHAEFFVGLSSGLAWLAHAVDCPVVMVCGFSQDWFEFHTPYRVANRLVCNGCLNDVRVNFLGDICPYHHGTGRELECQKKISPRQVINAIEQLIIDRGLTPPVMR